jgi:hypothetical protein
MNDKYPVAGAGCLGTAMQDSGGVVVVPVVQA